MRASAFGLLLGSLLLAGCNSEPVATAPGNKNAGRFAGIGVFDAGRLWAQMARAGEASSPQAASLEDDEHVIVVIDSHTGEVRQCGDHSGHCVNMNPWASKPASAPVSLKKHAADLADENKADTLDSAGVTNATEANH